MINDYDVIILGLSRWDNALNSSTFCIAKEFAANHRVFYIDRPFSIKDYLRESNLETVSSRKAALLTGNNTYRNVVVDGASFINITPRMSIPLNVLPDGSFFDLLFMYNLGLVKKVIRRTIHEYGIKNYIYINSFLPAYYDVIPGDVPQPIAGIYRSCDDISQEKYIARHGIRKEIEAVKKADIVIATSHELCSILGKFGKKVHRIPNAADLTMFTGDKAAMEVPPELAKAKGRIIIYTGKLTSMRVDIELLYKIARAFSNDTLVFVGPYDETEVKHFKLDDLDNVIFTGPKPMHELYAYLVHASCAIIPFYCNTLTRSIYPLKINEYLACGLPVVSTPFSEDILGFSEHISIVPTHGEFIKAIEDSLIEHNTSKAEKNRKRSEHNTWKQRVDTIKGLVSEFIKKS